MPLRTKPSPLDVQLPERVFPPAPERIFPPAPEVTTSVEPDAPAETEPAGDPDPSPRPFEAPEWLTRRCQSYASALSNAIRQWEQVRAQFLNSIRESAGHGHFPVTPTVADMTALLREHASAPDHAAMAAIDAWIAIVAGESVESIARTKEIASQNAIREAERAREYERQRQTEAERRALMERSEWERQDVLAREAEAAKWRAYEAQQAAYADWKGRTAAAE